MRNVIMRLAAAFVLMLAISATASAQAKVAIINTQKALLETAELKKAQADLEAKFKPRTDALRKLDTELQDVQNRLQAGAGKLTPQVEADLQTQGTRKQREMTRLQEDLQADVERERQDILARSGTRMQEVLKKLAEEKGWDLVVDVASTVYFKAALEVTAEATAAYDKAHPVK